MPLPPAQTLPQFQTAFVNGWASALNPAFGVNPANIPVGDPINALGFAAGGVATLLQAYMVGLVNYSRASTATGPDLDSWMADFDFFRPGGGQAQGWISVPTPTGLAATSAVPVPAGSVFQTDPIVISPSTVPTVYYFTTTAAVTIAIGQTFVLAHYQANLPGSVYNAIPALSNLTWSSSIVGTGNPTFALAAGQTLGSAAPQGGTNADSDPAARQAFIQFIDSLSGSTGSALIAGIEETSSYLQAGSTFVLWDYATQPAGVQLAWPGQAVCVFVSPNPANAGQYMGPTGTDPIADGILAAMRGTLANPVDAVAFSVVPIVYYANTYELTGNAGLVVGTIYVSQSAMSNAGLSEAALLSALLLQIQTLVGFPGGPGLGISQGLSWSAIINVLVGFSVTQPSGATVTGIVTDVPPAGLSGLVTLPTPPGGTVAYNVATLHDDGMLPALTHQASIESGLADPSGILRIGALDTAHVFPNVVFVP